MFFEPKILHFWYSSARERTVLIRSVAVRAKIRVCTLEPVSVWILCMHFF